MMLFIALPVTAFAESDWTIRAFRTPGGFTLEEVRDIVQLQDDSLWFASWGLGVGRLNGAHLQRYTFAEGLPSDSTQALSPDGRGGVWVATNGGIAHILDDRVTAFTLNEAPVFQENWFTAICKLENGEVWAGDRNGNVYRFNDADPNPPHLDGTQPVWSILDIPSQTKGHTISDIEQVEDGSVWIVFQEGGILRFDDQTWRFFELNEIPYLSRAKNVHDFGNGEVWITGAGGAYAWDGDQWQLRSDAESLYMQRAPNGDLFSGTAWGLRWMRDGQWRDFPIYDPAVGSPLIRVILFTRDGTGWVGTQEGVLRILKPPWEDLRHSPATPVTPRIGQAFDCDPEEFPLSIDHQNHLIRFENGSWKSLFKLPGTGSINQFLIRDVKGRAWIRDGEHVYRTDLALTTITQKVALPPDFTPHGMLWSRQDQLLLFGEPGIYALKNGTWLPLRQPQSAITDAVFSLHEVDNGLLVCGSHRVEIWSDIQIKEIWTEQSIEGVHQLRVARRFKDGRYWIGTLGSGIFVTDGVKVEQYSMAQGLLSNRITALFEAADGTIWAGAQRRGVASFRHGRWVNFTHDKGLPNAPVNVFGEWPQGTIWVATEDFGVYRYHAGSEGPVTWIVAHPEVISPGGAGVFSFNGYDAWDMTRQADLLFSWRIRDMRNDQAVVDWSSLSQTTTVVTPNLQPGRYSFEVIAVDLDHNETQQPAITRFSVLPPLWQRKGFLLPLFILILLALLLASIIYRKHQDLILSEATLKQHHDHLDELVREKTSELQATQRILIHQEKLAALGRITTTVGQQIHNPLASIATSLHKLLQTHERQDEAGFRRAWDRALRNTAHSSAIIEELLDYTRSYELNLEMVDFDLYVTDSVNSYEMPAGIAIELDLKSEAKVLIDRDRLRRSIRHLIKNAIEAFHEARTSDTKYDDEREAIKVTSRRANGQVVLTIEDSGPGIPEHQLTEVFEPLYSTRNGVLGLGLPIVQQVVEQHHGEICIDSELGTFTSVRITLPMDMSDEA